MSLRTLFEVKYVRLKSKHLRNRMFFIKFIELNSTKIHKQIYMIKSKEGEKTQQKMP